jgi:hypothetical protein
MTDLDPRLQRLLDENDIRNLTSRYCLYIWTRDIRVVDLYAPDGEFGDSGQGHDALHRVYSRIFDRSPEALGMPYIHNHVIDFDAPDHARGHCALDLRSVTSEGKLGISALYYDDEYVRTAEGWRFRNRQARTVLRAQLDATITAQSADHLGRRPLG